MKTTSGQLTQVLLVVGRPDQLVYIYLDGDTVGQGHTMNGLDADITVEGTPTTFVYWLSWLAEECRGRTIQAVLHDDEKHYGAIIKAEFTVES